MTSADLDAKLTELLGLPVEAKREDIDKLLVDKLSDVLNNKQKNEFIGNLLQEMRREGMICTDGSKRWAKWRLT